MAKLNVKDAIKTAIQMEKDGHAFYTKAAGQTKNDLGRTVFESLAADELVHLETFQKIFKGKIDSVEWNTLVQSNSKYTKPYHISNGPENNRRCRSKQR
jgi:rubrerythrin